jgi:small subunit ribosomal protein S25e
MPPKVQKSKAAKLLAAQSSSKSKGKKKKWSKGKLREKRNHLVVYSQSLLDKVLKEVPKKIKVITVYNLVEMYKINGSLARRTIKELLKRGTIKCVQKTAHLGIYTKAGSAGDGKKDKKKKDKGGEESKKDKKAKKGKKGKKKKGDDE